MSSKPAEPRSIATQLVFLFAPAAALLLFCGLGVLYWIVVRHAYAEDRAVLLDKVMAVRTELKSAGGAHTVNQELRALQGGRRATYWVRVLDSAGRIVAETPGMDQLLPMAVFSTAPTNGRRGAGSQGSSNAGEVIFVSLGQGRRQRPCLHHSGGAGSLGRRTI